MSIRKHEEKFLARLTGSALSNHKPPQRLPKALNHDPKPAHSEHQYMFACKKMALTRLDNLT